ncbi:hypothetical protein [Cellulomonas hominis]|uniref:hypothetical protein n=1 Tax=Cellulomonas hominis TaxID=156981 RepID=UPI001B99590C|nr:hypothetical protein [Cellulomonas hominis]VTR76389.1 hypothetical protein CHMI_01149 [Cellulomonas hominis]
MQRERLTWWGRLRRPASLVAAAAVVAVVLPASPAMAANSVTISPPVAGAERAGESATYDFSCDLDTSSRLGAYWVLTDAEGVIASSDIDLDEDTFTHRSGSFTINYADLAAGQYTIVAACYLSGQASEPQIRPVALVGDVETVTSVVSPGTVVAGQPATLAATTTGVPVGSPIEFKVGQTVAGTAPVDANGRAEITYTFTEWSELRANYAGAPGFKPSGSYSSVNVITDVTAGHYGYGPFPTVGQPAYFETDGWKPTVEQGLRLSWSWALDGVPVSEDPTFTPQPGQEGKALSVTVTGSHPTLAPGTAKSISQTLGTIQRGTIAAGDLALDGTVDGQAVLGQVLTPRPSGWAGASIAYEWFIGDNEFSVPGATYTPTAADLGKTIRVRATVTAPGMTTVHDDAWAWAAVATPTVTVGSSTVVVGRDAVVPVKVSGPAGAPVPAGDVRVTLTPKAGGSAIVLDDALLNGKGSASVTVPGLAVGTYAVSVAYLPTPSMLARYAVTAVDMSTNPYLEAQGSGTVTVTKATLAVSAPATLDVPVATQGALKVTVGGFVLPQTFVVREGETVLGQGQLAQDGVIAIDLPVLTPGTHDLVVDLPETASTLAASGAVRVTVGGEPARVGALPTAELETPKAATAPGQQMELVAEGFEPGETVAFYLHSDPVFLGTAVADANGVARLLASIPADVPTGAHTVIATGGTSGRWASLPVVLAVPGATPAASPAAAGDDLAVTGAQSGALMAGAWLLLLVGAGLVVVARRVRSAR